MRLLYLLTEPFGIGGVQSDILTLTENLNQRGHSIYVATTRGVLLDELIAKGAQHIDIDFCYRNPLEFWRAAVKLRHVIQLECIDLVAPQSVRSTLVAYSSLRLWPFSYRTVTNHQVPIITTIHNIHNPLHFYYAGHLLQYCTDYVIFESHYERNRLLASGLNPEKSTVIHSGIDTDRFMPREYCHELATCYQLDLEYHCVFGIVARLSEEKGHHYLLSAFAHVYREQPRVRLMIVGDGPLKPDLQAQVQKLKLDQAVIFTGLQRNIPDFLSLFDVFVLSSTRESFPLAAREAMAAGKPVIAPRIGGCPEVVDDGVTGYLFEAGHVSQLADCMHRILNEGRHKKLGHAARKRVERLFSQRVWVDGDEQVYLKWYDAHC